MTGGGACDGDMPTFLTSDGYIPPVGDPAYDAMLARILRPEEAPPGLAPVAEAFDALNAAPAHGGVTAEANALAAFRGLAGRPAETSPRPRRRRPVLTSLLSAKFAAAAAAAAVTLGSAAAAAAYAGKLPASVQNIAHDTIGAPKTPGAQPARPVAPQPTKTPGRAAYGLCTAFAHLKAHGRAAQRATAFRRLAAAAGGATHVSTYCAGVPHPGAAHPGAATGAGAPGRPSGKPSALPSPAQRTHPAGKPTTPPSHAPASPPAGKPTSTP